MGGELESICRERFVYRLRFPGAAVHESTDMSMHIDGPRETHVASDVGWLALRHVYVVIKVRRPQCLREFCYDLATCSERFEKLLSFVKTRTIIQNTIIQYSGLLRGF